MARFIVVAMTLLALVACSSPSPTEEFLTEMHATGLVPELGSDGDALNLAESICERLDEGDSVESQMGVLQDNGFTRSEAGDMIDASVTYFCPRQA